MKNIDRLILIKEVFYYVLGTRNPIRLLKLNLRSYVCRTSLSVRYQIPKPYALIVFLLSITAVMFLSHAKAAMPLKAERDQLTVEELMADAYVGEGPIENRYFMPIGPFSPARHEFSGTLTIPETKMHMTVISFDSYAAKKCPLLPTVTIAFFTHRGNLIPVERDIIRSPGEKSYCDIILSPGRVWSEPSDKGFSRASFPFVLSGAVWNEAHNGIATFVYNDTQISSLRFQIVEETMPMYRFDAWGQTPMTFVPGTVKNKEALAADFDRELRQRLPTRPWSDLLAEFGSQGLAATRLWPDSEWVPVVSGLIIDGVIYVSPCHTRFGDYPYCDEMRHGVFSMTKTLGALLSMLRLAQKYGDDVFELKIKDFLNVTADHNGWDKVTFADALNMVTGVGEGSHDPNSNSIFEDNGRYFSYVYVMRAKEKLKVAFSTDNYPWGPDEVLRYRSMDTFILAAAMDSFLKSKEGSGANLWDMIREEVLKPIGVFHAPMLHTEESDGSRGIPILGEGFFPTFHDIAKIAMLFQNGGKYDGKQLLSERKLREALYQTSARGKRLPKGRGCDDAFSYYMSFWYLHVNLAECDANVPTMTGYGGNRAQLLPNGMIAFYLQDGKQEVHRELVFAADKLRPFCPQ
jgi:CubicO group peptidase (beta-lactamase class C family)